MHVLHDTLRSFGSLLQRNFLAKILKQQLAYEETKARTLPYEYQWRLAFYLINDKLQVLQNKAARVMT